MMSGLGMMSVKNPSGEGTEVWELRTRKIGVLSVVTVYLANLLYNITTTLIDFGS